MANRCGRGSRGWRSSSRDASTTAFTRCSLTSPSASPRRWLFDSQLVDEIILLTYPVVIGQGTRLFPDSGRDAALDLVESRAFPKGITIQVYRPNGRPQYATD